MLIWKTFRTSPVYEHTTITKRRDSFDPQSLNLLREDSICMVNLLEIPRMVVFFCQLYNRNASVVSEEELCFVKTQ